MASKYEVLDTLEHILTKDMWAGSKVPIEREFIMFDPQAQGCAACITRTYIAPALLVCIDEPITNAIDQAQRCTRTSRIDITFSPTDGRISVANDGDGIPVTLSNGRGSAYIPTIIFSVPFSGTNLRTDTDQSTLGGTNGLGVKITNIHSREFCATTYDRARSLSFTQTWTNNSRDTTGPVIAKSDDRSHEGTRVSFLLDFALFQATELIDTVGAHVYTRAVWASLFLAQFVPRVTVTWNGSPINWRSMDIARAVFLTTRSTKQQQQDAREVDGHGHGHGNGDGDGDGDGDDSTVLSVDSDQSCDGKVATYVATQCAKCVNMSIINGVVVPDGNHIARVSKIIKDRTKEIVAGALHASRKTVPTLRIKISIIMVMNVPGVHWDAQTKDRALFTPTSLREFINPSSDFVERVANVLARNALASLNAHVPVSHSRINIPIDKYRPARYAGTAKRAKCGLILAEGDSAMSSIGVGISRNRMTDYYGILTLRGVIINARKESDEVEDEETGEIRCDKHKKALDNQFIKTLCQVLNLENSCDYRDARNRARLRYGHVVACVDQDVDGTGNIFSLVLNLFHRFYPSLLESGFVRRLETPIIRAYPKGRARKGASSSKSSKQQRKVLEFYSDEEYKAWVERVGNSATAMNLYDIRYYKGLGTHEHDEIYHIVRNMQEHLITYTVDDTTRETFEVYLGRDPELRKEQLSHAPPSVDPELERARACEHSMPASYHLLREAHAYQIDNISRKINDVIDGTNQVSCKIIDGCISIFAHDPHGRHKISELAGTITAREHYHHGETSLQDAIIRRAFIAPGGMQLPFLLPSGNFGTRNAGGQDASSARYLYARYNAPINDLIFRASDYPVLTFRYDEGERCEPVHFMPIIPLALTESIHVPAHGWRINIWAREVMDIIGNLRRLIASNGRVSPIRMRPCCYPTDHIDDVTTLRASTRANEFGERIVCDCTDPMSPYLWHGLIVETFARNGSELWSLGIYEWASDTVINITELPLGKWSTPYAEYLHKIEMSGDPERLIKNLWSALDSEKVCIQVTLNEQSPAYAILLQSRETQQQQSARSRALISDPVIIALGLRARMSDNINFMAPDSSVITFRTYEEVLTYWFPWRRDFYAKRITRELGLLDMQILRLRNICRYISEVREGHFSIANKQSDEEASSVLSQMGFDKLNVAILSSPNLKYTSDIVAAVTGTTEETAPLLSHAYLLDLRERDMTMASFNRYKKSLDSYMAERQRLDQDARIDDIMGYPFVGARIWMHELDELARAIEWGRKTHWKYDEDGMYTFA
jgi:DNA topoisomerase-2